MRQPAMVRQWWRSVGGVAVALTVVAYGLAFAQSAEDTQKKLQGTWTATQAERDGKAADDVVGHRLLYRQPLPDPVRGRQAPLCGNCPGGPERAACWPLTSRIRNRPQAAVAGSMPRTATR